MSVLATRVPNAAPTVRTPFKPAAYARFYEDPPADSDVNGQVWYSRGQNMGELAMREITGLLWMADVINRAKSVEPAALDGAQRWLLESSVTVSYYV